MKRPALVLAVFLLLVPAGAQAQSSAIGVSIGTGESLKDRLDFGFGDTAVQLYYETSFGGGTSFRVQYGTLDTQLELLPDDPEEPKVDATIEYVDLVSRYEFDEVYGQSSLFAGLGFYRSKVSGLEDEKDWGLVLGVDGTFPVSRRLALTAEIAYRWANFDENLSVLVVSGGAKVRF